MFIKHAVWSADVSADARYLTDLTAIHTYFTRCLIRHSTSLVRIGTIFATFYVFGEIPNSYKFVPMTNTAAMGSRRMSEVLQISHLIKYVQIGREIGI